MNKEIKYQGYSNVPSDYLSGDGQLALSLGLINEDGSIRALEPPAVKMQLEEGERIACVHETAEYKHYVILTERNFLKWVDSIGEGVQRHWFSPSTIGEVYGMRAVGNTLCVLTPTGLQYFLWEADNSGYRHLGQGLPETKLSFGLQGHIESKMFTVSIPDEDARWIDNYGFKDNETNHRRITDKVQGALAEFIAEQVQGKGRFCMPFFVRYAYRTVGGEYTMQSAPILMLPSTGAPLVYEIDRFLGDTVDQTLFDTSYASLKLLWQVAAPACKLDMACMSDTTALSRYRDIIDTVDIFVSAPVYTYDTSGTMKGEVGTLDEQAWGVFALDNVDSVYSGSSSAMRTTLKKHSRWSIELAAKTENIPVTNKFVKLPKRDATAVKNDLTECSGFYLVKSIPIEELSSERAVVEISRDDLSALVTLTRLPDDYDSHDRYKPRKSFVYNSRLHLYQMQKELFNGYLSQPFVEGYVMPSGESTTSEELTTYEGDTVYKLANTDDGYGRDHITLVRYKCTDADDVSASMGQIETEKVFTWIKRDGRTVIVEETSSQKLAAFATSLIPVKIPYFYHPDSGAYKAAVYFKQDGLYKKIVLSLKKHAMLNGAYFYGLDGEQTVEGMSAGVATGGISGGTSGGGAISGSISVGGGTLTSAIDVTASTDKTVRYHNLLYTSSVGNPFVYPAKGVVQVGGGKIIGMASAAQALSEGQFGQFPLYVFTSEGIWALTVNNEGYYAAAQPLSRDVCINAESITPIDRAVLFASDRGLMIVEGSKVSCISEPIGAEHPWDWQTLPKSGELLSMLSLPCAGDYQYERSLQIRPFAEFLKGCRIIYDYTHQHIIVFNNALNPRRKPAYRYAYVLSLKSKMWGMQYSDLRYKVDSYPDALAITNAFELVAFSDSALQFEAPEETTSGSTVTGPTGGGLSQGGTTVSTGGITIGGNTSTGGDDDIVDISDGGDSVTGGGDLPVVIPDSGSDETLPKLKGLLVTRPLKLDAPDVLKTVLDVVQRGQFERHAVKTALYASRDLNEWYLVGTSTHRHLRRMHGTAWKYYRIAVYTEFTTAETLTGASMIVVAKLTDTIR